MDPDGAWVRLFSGDPAYGGTEGGARGGRNDVAI